MKISIISNAGFTITELLVSMSIISIIMFLGVLGFNSFVKRIEILSDMRILTSTLSRARYESIMRHQKLRVSFEKRGVHIQEKANKRWKDILKFILKNSNVRSNRFPVFHPDGMVSPLCSIEISNRSYLYKISISIAGRFRIRRLY